MEVILFDFIRGGSVKAGRAYGRTSSYTIQAV